MQATFGAILHPVKRDGKTGEKDLGPIRKQYSESAYSYDFRQEESAKNYAIEAGLVDSDEFAIWNEAPPGRFYVFTKENGKDIQERLKSDESLQLLNRAIQQLKSSLKQLENKRDQRSQAVVGEYLSENRADIQEVSYKSDYKVAQSNDKSRKPGFLQRAGQRIQSVFDKLGSDSHL